MKESQISRSQAIEGVRALLGAAQGRAAKVSSIGIVALWLASSIANARHLQDDAFIHLRFMKNIGDGHLSFNEGQHSLGTSSPAYDAVLWLLTRAVPVPEWPMVTKLLGVAFSFASLALALAIANSWTRLRIAPLRYLIPIVLATPTVVRWLQDGMETSIVCFGVLLALYFLSETRRGNAPNRYFQVIAILILGVFRLDAVPLALAFTLLCGRRYLRYSLVGLILAAVALTLEVSMTGHLLSDAAIAKQTGSIVLGTIPTSIKTFVAFPALIAVLILEFRHIDRRLHHAIAIAPLVTLIAAATIQGQAIQGLRYFLPPSLLALGVIWIGMLQSEDPRNPHRAFVARGLAVATCLQVGVTAPGVIGLGVARWGNVNRDSITARSIGAFDIGTLSWRTNIEVVDLAGLVNGREVALHQRHEKWCSAINQLGMPNELALSPEQERVMNGRSGTVVISCKNATATFERTKIIAFTVGTKLGVDQPTRYYLYTVAH